MDRPAGAVAVLLRGAVALLLPDVIARRARGTGVEHDREQRPPDARRWRDAGWQIARGKHREARGAASAAQRPRIHAVRVTVQALAASSTR
ncbi:hypothetical protein [Sorangium sp. So ce388]|uniref:hypothetical protein n=1 Tax=Sorangium sp. So ce388 TaxID=3133309 RepID=UPI003F5B556B